jgi:hypothetical protein
MAGEKYETLIQRVKPERARSIGSWVLGVTYMKQLSEFIASADTIHAAIDPINASTKKFLLRVSDEEFRTIREELSEIAPDSNSHTARWRMGVTSKTSIDTLGNKFFVANQDFVLATYYHEDSDVREKIDARAGVTDLIEADQDQFVKYYLERATSLLETKGQEVRISDVIHDARLDMEYWLPDNAA